MAGSDNRPATETEPDPVADGLRRLSALADACVEEAATAASRGAALAAWLSDRAAVDGGALAAVDDPTAFELRIARIASVRGGGTIAGAVRRAIRPGVQAAQVAQRERLRARASTWRADAPEGADAAAWAALDLERGGRPRPTGANIYAILTRDAEWAGKIRYNEWCSQVEIEGAALSDPLETEIGNALATRYRLDVRTPAVDEQIRLIADRNRIHPVREYLAGLRWDGESRLFGLFANYFGAPDTALNAALGMCWLIGAVARVQTPGCKLDNCIVLCGPQGIFKSTAIRALVPEPRWYADTPLEIGNKDRFEQIQGKWLYELAEIDKFKGADQGRVKALFSSATDRWRRPFGRNAVEVPRQVAFVGSVNPDEFLEDPTGDRRFWPVRCGVTGALRPAAIAEIRDQLWAEALERFRRGEPYHLSADEEAEREEVAAEFRVSDTWQDVIGAWAHGKSGITVEEILSTVLEIPLKSQTKHDQGRASACLRRLGWVRRRDATPNDRGQRRMRWFKPEGV